MKNWQVELTEFLARSGALLFGEFKLKSGRLSPFFFNIAKAINSGEGLLKIGEFYIWGVFDLIGGVNFDFLVGPAYKAIPLAAVISTLLYSEHGLSVRWGYDRKEEKSYGVSAEKWFVGDIRSGDRLLLVDDVATTGKTKIDLIRRMREVFKDLDLRFQGVLILLDREEIGEDGRYSGDVLRDEGVSLYSLLKVSEVFEYLYNRPVDGRVFVSDREYSLFQDYRRRFGASTI
ncbi:MAG: orotate phosphoribosyltransferase [Candidatus Odinarchaeum yellowstonii]|uniref:Orotate phosphoribosyltransferase n=1 Tax=Odinarchaeota yellowstonii (strain LCB_4) TaxID=1841599 RepID=A0AAF0D2C1_ODILC|nr:MAG: orotate phosphoribosyltransferase [Candidatus Odinarchaeum yellowstonii]